MPVIVRVPLPGGDYAHKRMPIEHALLQYLQAAGFHRAPRSLFFGYVPDLFRYPLSIQSYVAGLEPDKLSISLLQEIGEVLASLHSLTADLPPDLSLANYVTWGDFALDKAAGFQIWLEGLLATDSSVWISRLAPTIQEAFQKVQSMIERYRNAFECQVNQITLIHGDLGLHNLRLTKQGVYLMDWEFAMIGDPAYDIGILFRNQAMSGHQRDEFLAVYSGIISSAASRDFLDRLNFYELVAAYQNALWAVKQLSRGAAGQLVDKQTKWLIAFASENLAHIDPEISRRANKILLSEAAETE